MKGTRTHFNQGSLALIVLITGVVGGLLIVFSILLLCKYCLNRKNLREAEQMKLLYGALSQVSLNDGNRRDQLSRKCSRLEPRRSNPLDRYQLPEDQWQIPSSKNPSLDHRISGSQHGSREQIINKQHDSYGRNNDDEPGEQAYLQVDPRCYVRQNSSVSLSISRKSDTPPRLEKGLSLNVDTRPSPSPTSLSPYRQSSFDVPSANQIRSQQQSYSSTLSPSSSTQQDIYYTPRGSCLSVLSAQMSGKSPSNQHLTPTPVSSRKNSAAIILEKKDLTVTLDSTTQPTTVRSLAVQRDHERSTSFAHSSSPPPLPVPTNSTTSSDKQSRSFDAVHLLRPVTSRGDMAVNRRTKSYECADEHRSNSSVAPLPIVIKIPDMTELVNQAAQLSRVQNRRLSIEQDDYPSSSRKATLVQQISTHDLAECTASQDLWRLRQSYEYEEQQQQQDIASPDDFSPDLLTSTSIDSAGAMMIHPHLPSTMAAVGDDDPSKYQFRRKSSSNLLLPPPEVRRQALRRTFEKRRSCINESNARREQQQQQQLLLNTTPIDVEEDNSIATDGFRSQLSSTLRSADFSSLLNNFNSRSENSSFERSLETDFDMQSDTSSRGPNDQFTSIESSGNENAVPDAATASRVIYNRQQQQQPFVQQNLSSQQQLSSLQNDSGYKSLESQNSQNRTFSLDWMSADGAESVIYLGDTRLAQQRSVDVQDLEEDLAEHERQQQIRNQRRSPMLLHAGPQRSFQEPSTTSAKLNPSTLSPSGMMQQRSLSTNIPLVEHQTHPIGLSPMPIVIATNQLSPSKLVTSSSFSRTASKKRREFGKDKRHAASNVGLQYSPTDEQHASALVYQVSEISGKPHSSLQVRYPDLRRTKSEDSRNLVPEQSVEKEIMLRPTKNENNARLSSSADGLPVSGRPSPPAAPRQHLAPTPPDHVSGHHSILQRSPSSTTPPVTISPQILAFRSQRGSLSFDTQSPPSTSSSSKTKASTPYAMLSPYLTKSRLKFSTVRDSTTAITSHNPPVYSMPIARDYSIDEKTNRIVNEFLMHDPSLDDSGGIGGEDSASRAAAKRHHHRVRTKTIDETSSMNGSGKQQQYRAQFIKQRPQSFFQPNVRKPNHHRHPTIHLTDSIEQDEDSSDPASSVPLLVQPTVSVVRRENSTAGSPAIIITGEDSGS